MAAPRTIFVIDPDALTKEDKVRIKILMKQFKSLTLLPVTDTFKIINNKVEEEIQFIKPVKLRYVEINPRESMSDDHQQQLYELYKKRVALNKKSDSDVKKDILKKNLVQINKSVSDGIVSLTGVTLLADLVLYECKNRPDRANAESKKSPHYKLALVERYLARGSHANVYLSTTSFDVNDDTRLFTKNNKRIEKQRIVKMFHPEQEGVTECNAMRLFAPDLRAKKISQHITYTKRHDALISAYVPGEELFQFITDFKFNSDYDRLVAFYEILIAAKKIHALGGVHRDIKPENIIIWRDSNNKPRVKIVDFGSAVAADKRDKKVSGTYGYAAPEILSGAGADFKADVYSLSYTLDAMHGRGSNISTLQAAINQAGKPFTPCLSHLLDHNHDRHLYSAAVESLQAKMRIIDPQSRIELDDVIMEVRRILGWPTLSMDELPELIQPAAHVAQLATALPFYAKSPAIHGGDG